MKAYLIDPAAKTVTQVEHNGDYKEIYKLCDFELFTVIELDRHNTLYLDDEGFLQAGKEVFYWDGYDAPLCGKALILGSTQDGDSCGTTLLLDDVLNHVTWTDKVGTGDFGSQREGYVDHPVFGRMACIETGKPILTDKVA